jgi:hypothetical protein
MRHIVEHALLGTPPQNTYLPIRILLVVWEPSDRGFRVKALGCHVQPDDGDACGRHGPPWRRHRGLPQLVVSRVKTLGPWAGQWRRFYVTSFPKPLSWDVVLLSGEFVLSYSAA